MAAECPRRMNNPAIQIINGEYGSNPKAVLWSTGYRNMKDSIDELLSTSQNVVFLTNIVY